MAINYYMYYEQPTQKTCMLRMIQIPCITLYVFFFFFFFFFFVSWIVYHKPVNNNYLYKLTSDSSSHIIKVTGGIEPMAKITLIKND